MLLKLKTEKKINKKNEKQTNFELPLTAMLPRKYTEKKKQRVLSISFSTP